MNEKKVVKLLLKHGANPNIVNKYHKTPANLFESIYNVEISVDDLIKE